MVSKNIFEIYDMFDIVAKENYAYAKPFFSAKAIPYIPYEENEELQRYVKSIAKQTIGEYVNLTQHTAFAVFSDGGKSIAPLFDRNKDKVATSLSETYTKVIDYAVTKVQTGVTDYQSAMREVMKAMADSGIRTVDYATGYSRRLESAVRQNILWGVKQCNQNTADMIGKEFGADGYEISYHSHPRPSHADMGGKQFAIGGARWVNGKYYPSFEEKAEPLLNEFGCLHFKFSILLGISEPAYSEEQLAQFKAEDNHKIEFEGKEYTRYEAGQLQKRIESEVPRQKDRATIAKAAGDDVMRREAQYKINLLTGKYAKLSKESGLPTKMERMKSAVKPLTNGNSSGIMKVERAISARNMASGNRKPAQYILTERDIAKIKEDIRIIGADESVFRFNVGRRTGYDDVLDEIRVRGDILPDKNSLHPRDLMSTRAALAHEYYGHRAYRGTKLKRNAWNDEFRASYMAAKNTPNLSAEDRKYLVLDALERAKEKGVTIKHNDFIRRILYGY